MVLALRRILDEPCEHEHADRRGRRIHDVRRAGECVDVRVAHRVRQPVHGGQAERRGPRRAGRQRVHHPRLQPVREQRAEPGDAEQAADRTEQRRARRRLPARKIDDDQPRSRGGLKFFAGTP
ncbi:UNVERIFIED_ORG: hypothetical protein ABIC48_005713 [Burkholderia territorii]